ncbi:MAG: hypothetical protein FWG99_10150 [Treponema sp.]|nr:hypothetical protein [Treponema sp.]
MTITQTVDIPADRRITLEVPREVPAGKAQVELKVTPFENEDEIAAYKAMADDTEREQEAREWCNAYFGPTRK